MSVELSTAAQTESHEQLDVIWNRDEGTAWVQWNPLPRPCFNPDLLSEIHLTVADGERVLATTLTKRMAEDLTEYLHEQGVRVRYMHSDIETLERIEIIRGPSSSLYGTSALFAIVNVARHLDIEPELALRAATDKFRALAREMGEPAAALASSLARNRRPMNTISTAMAMASSAPEPTRTHVSIPMPSRASTASIRRGSGSGGSGTLTRGVASVTPANSRCTLRDRYRLTRRSFRDFPPLAYPYQSATTSCA